MKKENSLYLRHILDAIGQVMEYVKGMAYEDFIKKRMVQDAVTREIEIISEAAKSWTSR